MASRRPLQCCYRTLFVAPNFSSCQQATVPQPFVLPYHQSRSFVEALSFRTDNVSSSVAEGARIVPASPSYFTGKAEFFDNWLALQDLYRKYQTLPTVPADQAPRVRWKTLQQYRSILGCEVKSAKYKKILTLLNRLNRVEPSLLPEDAKIALDMYKREAAASQAQVTPKSIDKWGRAWAVGRRKTSSAKVCIVEGTGEVLINGKPLADAFPRMHDRESVIWPLYTTDRVDKYNIWGLVKGGGMTGQAEALMLGVAKALMIHEPLLKPALRRAGSITRDPRAVERKKPGHVKARKMPTWVKR